MLWIFKSENFFLAHPVDGCDEKRLLNVIKINDSFQQWLSPVEFQQFCIDWAFVYIEHQISLQLHLHYTHTKYTYNPFCVNDYHCNHLFIRNLGQWLVRSFLDFGRICCQRFLIEFLITLMSSVYSWNMLFMWKASKLPCRISKYVIT